MSRPPRKFKVGDQVRSKTGIYRGDLGVVIGIDTKRVKSAGMPAGSFQKLCYVVRLDDGVVRKYISAELEHP